MRGKDRENIFRVNDLCRVVRSERPQPPSIALKILIFLGFREAIVSQFVSQTVSQNSGRSSIRNLRRYSMTATAIAA
jgi:hypothetical protein